MKKNTFLGAALALVFLAACGSSDIGDILTGGGAQTSTAVSEVRGTVDSIDLNSRSMVLTNATTYSSSLQNGGMSGTGNSVRIYFDDQTQVEYQGRTYRPEDLERGDQVSVRVQRSGDRLIADTMTVTYNAAGSGTTTGNYTALRGTVRSIDTARRTLTIDRYNTNQSVTVDYDTNTYVDLNGRRFRPEDLERGDEIEINTRTISGRLVAQDINVLRSVSGTSGTTTAASLRGTVRIIDTARRTIELEQTSWSSRFNNSTNYGNRVVLNYDANTAVEYQGKLHPPTNLERGDVVDVQVRDLGTSGLLADRIILVRDVNAGF
jgi:hypothetical protein